ncbi:MAG TPA: cupin domain-containing protein [Rhizomicrobium sp.]|nr:cupin domain-containing protein [Rhizomicrobium sp.]
MSDKADDLIRELQLRPHPEGGHFREIFRDVRGPDNRSRSTAIYFLLKAGEVSHWHRIDVCEVWHWYAGAPLALSIAPGRGAPVAHILGSDIMAGQRPQLVVPERAWQSARTLGDYTLAGCTVAPGFDFDRFELAPEGFTPS